MSPESMVEAIRGNHIEVVMNELPFLEHVFKHADFLSKLFRQMSWDILEAPFETGFILCDDPMVIVPPKRGKDTGFGVPGTVKYFPLAQRFCLRIGDFCGPPSLQESRREDGRNRKSNHRCKLRAIQNGPDKARLEKAVAESASAQGIGTGGRKRREALGNMTSASSTRST